MMSLSTLKASFSSKNPGRRLEYSLHGNHQPERKQLLVIDIWDPPMNGQAYTLNKDRRQIHKKTQYFKIATDLR